MIRWLPIVLALGVALFSPTAQAKPVFQEIPAYLLPITYKAESLSNSERDNINLVYSEEVAAAFWLKVVTPDELAASFPDQSEAIRSCTKRTCVKDYLRKEGINRVVILNIKQTNASTYQIQATVESASGQVQLRASMTEDGGAAEVRYSVPATVEKLFAPEWKKYGKNVKTVVETDTITSNNADRFLEKGDAAMALGNWSEALAQFDKAIELNPDVGLFNARRAEVKLQQGDLAGAQKDAKTCISKEEEFYKAYYILGHTLWKQGKTKQAIPHYYNSIRENESFLPAYFELGQILLERRKVRDAMAILQSASRQEPDNPTIQVNMAKLMLEQGKNAEAEKILSDLVSRFPDMAEPLPTLAQLQEESKDYAGAVKTYQRLVELEQQCGMCYYNLGRMLEETKQDAEAMDAYETTLDLDDTVVDAHYNLGMLSKRMDETIMAREHLQAYIEKETRPDQRAFVNEAKKVLATLPEPE